MHVRKRFARWLQPNRLLLVSVMSVGIVVAPSSFGNDIEAPPPPHSEPASESPVVPSTTPLPPATAPPPPTPPPQSPPGADRSDTRPADQTTADAEPTHPAVAGTMTAAAPVRLQIPAIGVDSELMGLGLQTDGTLEVPPGGFPAGWYTGAPTPGELGPAIIAGHVD